MLKSFNGEGKKANLKIILYDGNHTALRKGQNHGDGLKPSLAARVREEGG